MEKDNNIKEEPKVIQRSGGERTAGCCSLMFWGVIISALVSLVFPPLGIAIAIIFGLIAVISFWAKTR